MHPHTTTFAVRLAAGEGIVDGANKEPDEHLFVDKAGSEFWAMDRVAF